MMFWASNLSESSYMHGLKLRSKGVTLVYGVWNIEIPNKTNLWIQNW